MVTYHCVCTKQLGDPQWSTPSHRLHKQVSTNSSMYTVHYISVGTVQLAWKTISMAYANQFLNFQYNISAIEIL